MRFLLVLAALAQSPGSIQGSIIDANGALIPNASIELRTAPNTKPIATARSSGTGQFTFDRLDPGTYYLRITQTGFFQRLLGPVEISPGQAFHLPPTQLDVGKHLAFFCDTRLASPVYRVTAAAESILRGKFTIPAVTVTLTGGRVPVSIRTGRTAGEFEIPGISPGRYSLRATAPGFAAFEIKALIIPPKSAVEIEGWIDPPECPETGVCPPIRKTVQPAKSRKPVICL